MKIDDFGMVRKTTLKAIWIDLGRDPKCRWGGLEDCLKGNWMHFSLKTDDFLEGPEDYFKGDLGHRKESNEKKDSWSFLPKHPSRMDCNSLVRGLGFSFLSFGLEALNLQTLKPVEQYGCLPK